MELIIVLQLYKNIPIRQHTLEFLGVKVHAICNLK